MMTTEFSCVSPYFYTTMVRVGLEKKKSLNEKLYGVVRSGTVVGHKYPNFFSAVLFFVGLFSFILYEIKIASKNKFRDILSLHPFWMDFKN